MLFLKPTFLLLGSLFFSATLGHDETFEQLVAREKHVEAARRDLESCAHKLRARDDMNSRKMQKREAWINEFVEKRGITRRSAPFTKRQTSSAAVSCILAPEVTIGPYYLDGMPIRVDNREGEPGVEMLLEIEFVNTKTCTVIPNLYIDAWHANATGVYSGFQAEGTLGETQLRGLQPTDSDGIAHITTIFPGWYQGRAVHTHILAHYGGTVSGTKYVGGSRPHIGQIFYEQSLISSVGTVSPYTTNRNQLTTNTADGIFNQQNTGYDAIANTELIGSTIADGVIATISVGISI
ncbi:uncharacterized protein LAJ45_06935 [Morchella importuna]|uniref:uncharacterized protein n=1 Tax=Morchella importuna TaxID=1174673 RepID=UPI001E8CCC1A|nr:uncharacterized protein LAJ45_06935 [Morchella importuna]KAH8148960.1 hypothetical protein LAJ45_06935 [Morchella importuna]